MNHILTWAEIPVTDMNRAKGFYAEMLGTTFSDTTMEGYDMAMFDATPDQIAGALIDGEGYLPSKEGTVVYLNAGENLAPALARAEKLGADITVPKTPIMDGEHGYFAQLIDSEGNRVGLYSLK